MCLVMAMSLILLAVLTDIIPVHYDTPFIFNYGILLLSLFSSQLVCVLLTNWMQYVITCYSKS